MSVYVDIHVNVDDGPGFESFLGRVGIELPEDYDMGPVVEALEDVCWGAFENADEFVADFIKKDIEENYSIREYRVTVETREYVTRTYHYTLEAKSEDEARELAEAECESDCGYRYDSEEHDGFDSIRATDVELA